MLSFLCECGDLECLIDIELTLGEYRAVQETESSFAIAPGHEEDHELIVDEFDRYTIVEK